LRVALERAEAEAARVDAELAEVSATLADPAVYADGARVRELVERHNVLRDRTDALRIERERLGEELSAAEAEPQPDALAAR
jgi:ATP-binding cassette subfamily F protein 3